MSAELVMTRGAITRHLRMCKRLLANPILMAPQRICVEEYRAMLIAARKYPGGPDWAAVFAFFIKHILPILLMLLGL